MAEWLGWRRPKDMNHTVQDLEVMGLSPDGV